MDYLEALLDQLFLSVARVLFCEDTFLSALGGAIEGVGRFFGLVDGEVCTAAARMLDNSKVSAQFRSDTSAHVILGR